MMPLAEVLREKSEGAARAGVVEVIIPDRAVRGRGGSVRPRVSAVP